MLSFNTPIKHKKMEYLKEGDAAPEFTRDALKIISDQAAELELRNTDTE